MDLIFFAKGSMSSSKLEAPSKDEDKRNCFLAKAMADFWQDLMVPAQWTTRQVQRNELGKDKFSEGHSIRSAKDAQICDE